MPTTIYDHVPARYKLRRRLDEAGLCQTRETAIAPELLDSVFPEYRCRPQVTGSVPAELIADVIDASELRSGLADTQETPAIQDSAVIAETMLKRAGSIGGSPMEALRRMLDRECAAAAARLTPEERARIAAFDATVGIGLCPTVRR